MRIAGSSRSRFIARVAALPPLAAAAAMLPASSLALAADDAPPPAAALQDMARRLDQLEKKNAELEGEVKTLHAADGEAWLSEERAAQIRAIVSDTLADADGRASLQGSGMTAGWDNGFFLGSPDGRFKLQVGGMIQARYIYGSVREPPSTGGLTAPRWADGQEQRSGFDTGNSQLWFAGHVFGPGLTFKLRGRFANDVGTNVTLTNPALADEAGGGAFQLEDAWARIELDANWFVRVGQFRLPFSREELVDPEYVFGVDRSLVSYSLGLSYSQGIELAYISDLWRAQMAYSDGGKDEVGGQMKLVGTLPQNRRWDYTPTDWSLTGRIEFKPYGEWKDFDTFTSTPGSDFGLMFGLGAHWQSTRPDYGRTPLVPPVTRNENDWLMVTADASMNFGGASLFSSFTWSYTDSRSAYYYGNFANLPNVDEDVGVANKWGFVLQGGFYVTPKVELFARYELGQLSFSDPDRVDIGGTGGNPALVNQILARENHLNLATVGVNWYLDGHDAKFTGDFGYAFDSVSPSWYTPQTGWRVSDATDQWVARLRFQIVF
ncbi:MAG: porin [Phycisphaerae bacterium]|nr:porin [Phycisphaerae bacterium]